MFTSFSLPRCISLHGSASSNIGAHRGARTHDHKATSKPPAMAPKRANSKAAPSVDEAAKAALLAEKKGKALVR
jgi:hypothetical protein